MKQMLNEIQERQDRGNPPVLYRTRGRPVKRSGTRDGPARGETFNADRFDDAVRFEQNKWERVDLSACETPDKVK